MRYQIEMFDRHYEHDVWCQEVRDPAMAASEGLRTIRISKWDKLEYEIAPLPSGRWAITYDFGCCNGGQGTPWSEFETRERAIGQFLGAATRFLTNRSNHFHTPTEIARANKLLTALSKRVTPDGFSEPEPTPAPRYEDAVA